MSDTEKKYTCPQCVGTGSLESSNSTDESWWDCSTCKGTGKLDDRRRSDSKLLKGPMEPEILVNVSFRLPQADRGALADHIAPVMKEAIKAGGDTVHLSLQPYTPEEEEEE